jgi:hypothetical protein
VAVLAVLFGGPVTAFLGEFFADPGAVIDTVLTELFGR